MSARDTALLGLRAEIRSAIETANWMLRKYPVPAPRRAKWAVLARHGYPTGTWVESGTYLGRTSLHLARRASYVYTIEPSDFLASRARKRFRKKDNIHLINETSEHALTQIAAKISGDVSFWLDGHSSGGITFHGATPDPIREELSVIEKHLHRWPNVAVFIDDFRGFTDLRGQESAKPTKRSFVDWAESNGLSWTIEHDIFVAKR